VKDARGDHVREHGNEPSLSELAAVTSLRRDQVGSLVAAERFPRALDEPVSRDEGSGATFGELLEDPRAEDAYERMLSGLGVEDLPAMLKRLTGRELTILRARFGLGGGTPHTLREVGDSVGVSAERVRQIEQGALAKLHAAATAP
jgi:DNA-directed RNA polymerase sigma subunit (sigma70/sigma32)